MKINGFICVNTESVTPMVYKILLITIIARCLLVVPAFPARSIKHISPFQLDNSEKNMHNKSQLVVIGGWKSDLINSIDSHLH